MKILLIANYIPDNQQSMKRFADMLYEGLTASGHNARLIRPEPIFCRFKQSNKGLTKWLGYVDKLIIFSAKLQAEMEWADIIHICDHSNAIYVRYIKKLPHLITCNDLLAIRSALGEFKENPTKWSGRILQKLILNGLNQAGHVVCISEATKDDLIRLGSLSPERISVIYMGFNYPYSKMETKEAGKYLSNMGINNSAPFILHVGKNNWYKNRIGVLRIFRQMLQIKEMSEFRLVFAGAEPSKEMKRFISSYNLKQKVSIVFPTNEELRALYSTAEALIYPSLYEGFGWPIIEAQSCGCPVFTTNRPPMTEAGGDAAVYIEPTNPEETASIISRRLQQKSEIQKAGFLNIRKFSAEEMIKKYVEVYKKTCR